MILSLSLVSSLFLVWPGTVKFCVVNGLSHWGRMTHSCLSKLSIIGSDNGLSPGRRQAIIWTNAGILLLGTRGTNFNDILIKIHEFSFKKIHLKMSFGKWRPSCLGLNVLYKYRSLNLAPNILDFLSFLLNIGLLVFTDKYAYLVNQLFSTVRCGDFSV